MTKKDYIAIARVFAAQDQLVLGWTEAAEAVADMLAADNPRFNRARFLAACRGN